jgi:hypothetical protein
MDNLETPARIDPGVILGHSGPSGGSQRDAPARSPPLERRWKTCGALLPKEALLPAHKIRLAVLTPDRLGVDLLLAQWANALMGRFLPRRNRRLAVLAPHGICLDFFLAERTLARG